MNKPKLTVLKLTQFQLLLAQCKSVPIEEVATVNFASGYLICKIFEQLPPELVDNMIARTEEFMAKDPAINPGHAKVAINTLKWAKDRPNKQDIAQMVAKLIDANPELLFELSGAKITPNPDNPENN